MVKKVDSVSFTIWVGGVMVAHEAFTLNETGSIPSRLTKFENSLISESVQIW